MTFTLYGLTGYSVQYWNGAWVTVTGGSVTGNNKVRRKFTFSPITTSKIRVLTNASVDGYSRLTEVEAWGPTVSASGTTKWLVPDHLGTPRIILDQTGSLVGVKRHDYLPFGEELFAGTGGRTVAMGYAGDAVRQQFTAKERDVETGLDYFLARYYSSVQGRFTSIDTANADLFNPQTFNKYRYGLNNPLRYIDPDGRQEKEAWYKPILDYFKAITPKPEFNDPEERKPEKAPEYSPVIGNKENLIRKHFAGLVIGSNVVGETISSLDPIGSSAVVGSFMKGDTRGAVVAGVFALPNMFGVPKSALYSGDFLTAKVGNVQIGMQFSKADKTLNADILGLYGPRNEGLATTTRKLLASIMGFAKEEGFEQVRISGVALTNPELREKLIKHGWELTEVRIGNEIATGVSKTFPVK